MSLCRATGICATVDVTALREERSGSNARGTGGIRTAIILRGLGSGPGGSIRRGSR